MKKLIVIGIILFFIIAYFAYNPRIEVRIENTANEIVDSVIVSNGYDNLKFETLLPYQKAKNKLYFSDKVKHDGGYSVKVFRNGEIMEEGFGYYTNGSPIWDYISITIYDDTIKAIEEDTSFINF